MLRQMDPLASWTHPRSRSVTLAPQPLPALDPPPLRRQAALSYDGAAVHSSLRFQSSAASSGVATRLGARSAHLS